MIPTMTVIKINAITVAADSGDELGRRFAARAGAVDGADGFEGFELLRPNDDRRTWLVVTRWRDDVAFQAWVDSPAFGHGHRGPATADTSAPAPTGTNPHQQGSTSGADAPPVSTQSELWSYDIVDLPKPRG
jgi:heme-degrading monooxygenase HmoA